MNSSLTIGLVQFRSRYLWIIAATLVAAGIIGLLNMKPTQTPTPPANNVPEQTVQTGINPRLTGPILEFAEGDSVIGVVSFFDGYRTQGSKACFIAKAPSGGFAYADISRAQPVVNPWATEAAHVPACTGYEREATTTKADLSGLSLTSYMRGVGYFEAGATVFGIITLEDGTVLGYPDGCYINKSAVGGLVRALSTREEHSAIISYTQSADEILPGYAYFSIPPTPIRTPCYP